MLFFKNDYGIGCIDEILELLAKANPETNAAYGLDKYCLKAANIIKSKMVDQDVDIHFASGGTQTNQVMIKAALRPYEAVIAAESGHIATHETGSIEATGHKVITVNGSNGKVTPAAVIAAYDEHMLQFEHMVYPKMVYISNSTELGTVYTRAELEALRNVCDRLGLYLMMDGARIGVALMSGVDYTLNDIARWCDMFYIGGTKNGAMFGEAIVISNDDLKKHFRFYLKQDGALLAKGWLLGIQFIGLFENDAFYKVADHSNKMAKQIQEALPTLGYPLFMRSDTNQIFLTVTPSQFEYLKQYVDFETWIIRDGAYVIRLVTNWLTTQEEVDQLIPYLMKAKDMK